MRFSPHSTIVLALGLAAVTLAGCGSGRSRNKPEAGLPESEAAPLASGMQVGDRRISTFADSIDSVKFKFDQATGIGKLSLSFVDIDAISPDGSPYVRNVAELSATLDSAENLSFPVQGTPLSSAEIHCSNRDCAYDTRIVVKKAAGFGSDVPVQIDHQRTNLTEIAHVYSESTVGETTLKRFAADLREAEHRLSPPKTTYEVYRVAGGRTFFSIRMDIPNAGLAPENENYFDKKVLSVEGYAGASVKPSFARSWSQGQLSLGDASGMTKAEVIVSDSSPYFITIRLDGNEGLKALSVGIYGLLPPL